MTNRRVIVSPHAVERLLERSTVQTRNGVAHIFRDVQHAFADGRTSRRVPRWAVGDGYSRRKFSAKANGIMRYVWNADETLCYVLSWSAAAGDGRRSWIVLTTLCRASEKAVA